MHQVDTDPKPSTRLGRLLTVGFEGQTLTDTLRVLIDRGVAGVILFSRNIGSPQQVADLTIAIKEYANRPIYIGIDQEGGLVQRLKGGFTRIPPMRALGQCADPKLAYAVGALIGRELRAVNIDVDFAPVIDVDTNPNNPVIGNRSFSSNAEQVAQLGVAFGQGLESSGVAACGKHFPGHGDTELDSHLDLPILRHDWARLEQIELLPFRAWAKARLSSVMTAHVVFSALEEGVPATMSSAALKSVLRERLGFTGLVFSDDLEMKAVSDRYSPQDAAVRGLLAGVDQFLVCRSAQVAHDVLDGLGKAVLSGRVSEHELQKAVARNEAFLARWARPPRPLDEDQLESAEGQELVRAVLAGSSERLNPQILDPTERTLRG